MATPTTTGQRAVCARAVAEEDPEAAAITAFEAHNLWNRAFKAGFGGERQGLEGLRGRTRRQSAYARGLAMEAAKASGGGASGGGASEVNVELDVDDGHGSGSAGGSRAKRWP